MKTPVHLSSGSRFGYLLRSVFLGLCLLLMVREPLAQRKPLLVVGGLGESVAGSALVAQLHETDLYYGGKIQWIGGKAKMGKNGASLKGLPTFYVMDFSDQGMSRKAEDYAEELANVIGEIENRHQSGGVNVVAYSMGGIIARASLVAYQVPIDTLLTIATPHRGTYWANFTLGVKLLAGRYEQDLSRQLAAANLSKANAKVVNDLLLDEPGTFLHRLNRTTHPAQTTYIALCASAPWLRDLQQMVQQMSRKTVDIGQSDGIASVSSQKMSFIHGSVFRIVAEDHFSILQTPRTASMIVRAIVNGYRF